MRVLVYEHFSRPATAGGHDASLRRAGDAMRRAVARDLAALPGVRVAAPDSGVDGMRALRRALSRVDAALLIAPETGRVLERLAAAACRRGASLLGPGPRAIRLAADKVRCGRILRAAGIATPAPRAVHAGARARTQRKRHARLQADVTVVLKPRRGCGAEGVTVARGTAASRRAARHAAAVAGRDGVMAEEFVAGPSGSVSFLVRAGTTGGAPGDLLCLGVGRQRIAGVDRLEYRGGVLPWDPPRGRAAAALARRAVLALARASGDLRGFVGVDFVLGPRGPVVVDVNPRLTSSYLGLRERFGPPLARAMLLAARGAPLPRRLRPRGRARFLAEGKVRFTAEPAR